MIDEPDCIGVCDECSKICPDRGIFEAMMKEGSQAACRDCVFLEPWLFGGYCRPPEGSPFQLYDIDYGQCECFWPKKELYHKYPLMTEEYKENQ